MTDIGHAGTDEDLVDLRSRHRGQRLDVVGVVRTGEQGFGNLVEIDLEHLVVLGVRVGLQQNRILQPFLHLPRTPFERARVAVMIVDHPAQQGDVRLEIFDDRLLVEQDRAASCRALSGGVGYFESLLDFQFGQAFDLKHPAGEDVLLAFLGDGQVAGLNRRVGNRVDEVAQGDARLHFALETDEYRFRHVERHDAGGGGEGDEARACRKGNTDGETGMRVAAGADGVRQQHAIHPAMDDAVSGTQGNAAPGLEKTRQRVLGLDIHRLGIGRRMAEGLHHQVGGKAETGQILQFVPGHRAGGVLAADGGHVRLAIAAWAHAFDAAGPADHLLGEGISLVRFLAGHG